jgi:hypothetical protein
VGAVRQSDVEIVVEPQDGKPSEAATRLEESPLASVTARCRAPAKFTLAQGSG